MPKVRDETRVRRAKNSYMLWYATRVEDVKRQLNNKMREVNAQLGRVSFLSLLSNAAFDIAMN